MSSTGTATRIIGWGPTCPTRGRGSTPRVADELDTSIVADSRCCGINAAYEICTNNTNGNAGACYGDLPSIRAWANTQVGGLPAA